MSGDYLVFENWPSKEEFRKWGTKGKKRKGVNKKVFTEHEIESHIKKYGNLSIEAQAKKLNVSTYWYYILRKRFDLIKDKRKG